MYALNNNNEFIFIETKEGLIILGVQIGNGEFLGLPSKDFKITGTVITEGENTPLESATVYLERIKDSTLVTYTISDKNGKFSLEGKSFDKDLNLFISYVGYRTHKQSIVLDKENITLETIKLQTDANALDEVVITSRAPITVKKDTLEFNVASFKTKRDANVEDLLKQLPGVEVDEAGKITVNGKDVNKILVNGKPFFGNDPTITTKNLTKELISKVQITDTKSKAQAFTGEEGDGENKTINLTIREDKNKGVWTVIPFAKIITEENSIEKMKEDELQLYNTYKNSYYIGRKYKEKETLYMATPFKINGQTFLKSCLSCHNMYVLLYNHPYAICFISKSKTQTNIQRIYKAFIIGLFHKLIKSNFSQL